MPQEFSVEVNTSDLIKCYIELLVNELGEEPGSLLLA